MRATSGRAFSPVKLNWPKPATGARRGARADEPVAPLVDARQRPAVDVAAELRRPDESRRHPDDVLVADLPADRARGEEPALSDRGTLGGACRVAVEGHVLLADVQQARVVDRIPEECERRARRRPEPRQRRERRLCGPHDAALARIAERLATEMESLQHSCDVQAIRDGELPGHDLRDDLVELPGRRDGLVVPSRVAERVAEAAAELTSPVQIIAARKGPAGRVKRNCTAVARIEPVEIRLRQMPAGVRARAALRLDAEHRRVDSTRQRRDRVGRGAQRSDRVGRRAVRSVRARVDVRCPRDIRALDRVDEGVEAGILRRAADREDRENESGPQAETLTSALPRFSPFSIPMNARGAFSSPSVTVSR